jgi:hypothetical protein
VFNGINMKYWAEHGVDSGITHAEATAYWQALGSPYGYWSTVLLTHLTTTPIHGYYVTSQENTLIGFDNLTSDQKISAIKAEIDNNPGGFLWEGATPSYVNGVWVGGTPHAIWIYGYNPDGVYLFTSLGAEASFWPWGAFTFDACLLDAYNFTFDTKTRVDAVTTTGQWSGVWENFVASGAFNGSYERSSQSGSYCWVTFYGTQLDWIANKGTTSSTAYIQLDWGTPVKVDLYNSVVQRQVDVWSTGILPLGNHAIFINKDSAAPPEKFYTVDAFDIIGHLVQ